MAVMGSAGVEMSVCDCVYVNSGCGCGCARVCMLMEQFNSVEGICVVWVYVFKNL